MLDTPNDAATFQAATTFAENYTTYRRATIATGLVARQPQSPAAGKAAENAQDARTGVYIATPTSVVTSVGALGAWLGGVSEPAQLFIISAANGAAVVAAAGLVGASRSERRARILRAEALQAAQSPNTLKERLEHGITAEDFTTNIPDARAAASEAAHDLVALLGGELPIMPSDDDLAGLYRSTESLRRDTTFAADQDYWRTGEDYFHRPTNELTV
jgi:hypothetical protein